MRPGNRYGQLLLLSLAASCALYARSAMSPLQETMRVAWEASDNQMALLQGPALAVPLIIAAVPLGLLIDRYSRARLVLIFTGLGLLGTWVTAAANTFSVLFVARSLVGLSATATGTAAFSLLADLCAPAQRGRATLAVAVGQFAGSSAAFALGGWLLGVVGSGSAFGGGGAFGLSLDRWRLAMLWLSVPLVLVTVAMLALREPARTELAVVNPTTREAFRELWRYRHVVAPLLAGLVSIEIALQSALIWLAPALTRAFALQADRVGAIMAAGLLISGILGPIIGGVLADRLQQMGGPRLTLGVLSAMALLLAIPAGLFIRAPTVAVAGSLVIGFMILITALLVMGTALFTIVIPNELRGLCLSLFTSATLVFGVGLGPLSVSALSGLMGGTARIGWALSAVGIAASVFAAAAFLCGRKLFREKRRFRSAVSR